MLKKQGQTGRSHLITFCPKLLISHLYIWYHRISSPHRNYDTGNEHMYTYLYICNITYLYISLFIYFLGIQGGSRLTPSNLSPASATCPAETSPVKAPSPDSENCKNRMVWIGLNWYDITGDSWWVGIFQWWVCQRLSSTREEPLQLPKRIEHLNGRKIWPHLMRLGYTTSSAVESWQARVVDGGWSRSNDFGYSKQPINHWQHTHLTTDKSRFPFICNDWFLPNSGLSCSCFAPPSGLQHRRPGTPVTFCSKLVAECCRVGDAQTTLRGWCFTNPKRFKRHLETTGNVV